MSVDGHSCMNVRNAFILAILQVTQRGRRLKIHMLVTGMQPRQQVDTSAYVVKPDLDALVQILIGPALRKGAVDRVSTMKVAQSLNECHGIGIGKQFVANDAVENNAVPLKY